MGSSYAESELNASEFRALAQNLIGIATGYDFGPFQNPGLQFPLFNIEHYNRSLLNLPPVHEMTAKYGVQAIMSGGCEGLGADAPPLSYVVQLGRDNSSVFSCGIYNLGVHTYATHYLRSYNLYSDSRYVFDEGWRTIDFSILQRFLELSEQDDSRHMYKHSVMEEIESAYAVITELATGQLDISRFALSVSSLVQLVSKIAIGNNDSLLNAMRCGLNTYFSPEVFQIIDKIHRDRRFREPWKEPEDLVALGIISRDELKRLYDHIQDSLFRMSTSDYKYSFNTNQVPEQELNEEVVNGVRTKDVLNLIGVYIEESNEPSLIILDRNHLKKARVAVQRLGRIPPEKIKCAVEDLEPELTIDEAISLIDLYPYFAEVRRAQRLLKRGTQELGLVDRYILACSQVTVLIQILNGYVYLKLFDQEYYSLMAGIEIQSRLLKSAEDNRALLYLIYGVIETASVYSHEIQPPFSIPEVVDACSIRCKTETVLSIVTRFLVSNSEFSSFVDEIRALHRELKTNPMHNTKEIMRKSIEFVLQYQEIDSSLKRVNRSEQSCDSSNRLSAALSSHIAQIETLYNAANELSKQLNRTIRRLNCIVGEDESFLDSLFDFTHAIDTKLAAILY